MDILLNVLRQVQTSKRTQVIILPNFASDILVNVVRTKIPLISIFLVSCLDFRFIFSLVDDNAKCFRRFRHRFRRH